jgi:succinyl-diaminopimelate desuccinylase
LCALPAISPSSGGEGEAAKADALLKFLKNTGFEDITVAKAPDLDADAGYRPNIFAYYRGKNSSKTIWILCHIDVVPPGELSKWRGNPFKAQRRVSYGSSLRPLESRHTGLLLRKESTVFARHPS